MTDANDYTIRPFRTDADYDACIALQKQTWGDEFDEQVPRSHLILVQRIGGIAAGAFDADGTMIGFVYGLSGLEDRRPVHWSDMLAVRPEHRNRGVGDRLKRYQRERLLPLGVETVYWTFDPLESKNAYLNFSRLGVVCDEYHRNLYGDSPSPLHRGIGTDRFVVRWPIASERVARRLDGSAPAPSADEIGSAPLVNPTRDEDGILRSAAPDTDLDAPRVRVAVPAEIQALKAESPGTAAEWRRRTRTAFEAYFGRGYRAVEVVREGPRTCYLLEHRTSTD